LIKTEFQFFNGGFFFCPSGFFLFFLDWPIAKRLFKYAAAKVTHSALDVEMTDTTDMAKDIPVFVIGGPAGCGKSTVGTAIANTMHFSFIEGDALHPPSNIDKMSAGHPLVDADRWGWLDSIVTTSRQIEMDSSPPGIVVTCSALKSSYRDRLRKRVGEAREQGSRLREWFVFCNLSQEESLRRVQDRPGHYMKAGMVASQFHDLEIPDPQIEVRTCVLDVEKNIDEVDRDAIRFVRSCMSEG
jgi:gluconokinase